MFEPLPPFPPLPPSPLSSEQRHRFDQMDAIELRSEAECWDSRAVAAEKEGDKWDAAECRGMAAHCRRFARRKEIA